MDVDKVSPEKRKNEGKFLGKNHYTNNATVRIQRNQAEKQRRDRLNDQIAQLATLVPPAVNATKPLDKVSILRLTASWMRLHYSCLNEKRFKSAINNYLDMQHSLVANLDILQKSINGFIIATTFNGMVLMCSRYSEEYIGYQNIDLLGHNISNFVLPKEKDLLLKKIRNLISKYKKGSSNPRNVVRVRMQQRPLPRSNEMRYRKMSFSLSIHSGGEPSQSPVGLKHNLKIGRHKDFGENGVVLIFAEPVQMEPDVDVKYLEQKDCYFTIHGTQGEIIFADHRISTMTGYMPRDVLGNSAYQYIHPSDVPIALFAQKAMFESSDGTGMITYRLRICDTSYIYLQTKGQIRYRDSTKEVRQFICCNILLNGEDGNRELKKFQDKYAPQLGEAKLKRKESKCLKEPRTEANAGGPGTTKTNSVTFEHESYKRKRPSLKCASSATASASNDSIANTLDSPIRQSDRNCSITNTVDSPIAGTANNSIIDTSMEMEELNTGENSIDQFFIESNKKKYRDNYNRKHSSSSSTDIGSNDNSPESLLVDGFHGDSQSVELAKCNKILPPTALNCSVQNGSAFANFNIISPVQSPSDDASDFLANPILVDNDLLSTSDTVMDSSLLTSDFLRDFVTVDTVKEQNFFPTFQDNVGNRSSIQRNGGNNTGIVPDFFTAKKAFQFPQNASKFSANHDTNTHSNGSINGSLSQNNFSTFGVDSTLDDPAASKELGAANRLFLENKTLKNLYLSFLDQSVEGMALFSDFSDFYKNSMLFLKTNYDGQSQTKSIPDLSDAVANGINESSDLNNAIDTNSDEPNLLDGLFEPVSSDSHISDNAHSLQQFADFSVNPFYTSVTEDPMTTNGMQMDKFQNISLQQDWQTKDVAMLCDSPIQTIKDNVYNRVQTSTGTRRNGHATSGKRLDQLQSSMDSESSFLNHAQQSEFADVNGLVHQPNPSVL